MASSEVDQKYLGTFAANLASDNPLLSSTLYKLLGLSVILAKQLIKARKLRKLDPTRQTKSLDLYFHILWLSKEGLILVEQHVLELVKYYEELKVLSYKLRASFYHIFVLFHNNPSITAVSPVARQIRTPPGLVSPHGQQADKGKAPASFAPSPPESRASSVQPSHPLETGQWPLPSSSRYNPNLPHNGHKPVDNYANTNSAPGDFLIPFQDYIPLALRAFEEANSLSESLLWGSHPLRLSVKTEFCAFLYDCCKDYERSRQLAKKTIAEVYNSPEGMDDEMFTDAAELVGVLGRMVRRGLGAGGSGASGTTIRQNEPVPPRQLRSTPPRPENLNLRGEARRGGSSGTMTPPASRGNMGPSASMKVTPPSTPPKIRGPSLTPSPMRTTPRAQHANNNPLLTPPRMARVESANSSPGPMQTTPRPYVTAEQQERMRQSPVTTGVGMMNPF